MDPHDLHRALAAIAQDEARFTESFYQLFFARRPDTRPLFGLHSIAEQEEMMRETLRSLLALSEDAAWLAGNLEALGASHEEYGVTPDMYKSYVDVMLECVHETLDPSLDTKACAALREALSRVAAKMAEATATE